MPTSFNIGQGLTPIAISGTPTGATQRQAYSWSPTVTGGYGARSFTLVGELPPRMTFNPFNGTIGGIPRWATSVSGLSITVTDASGSATLGSVSIPVASAISNLVISGTPPAGIVGQAYSFTPTVSGGSGARIFSFAGRLEAGLGFNPLTGSITGTPTEDGGSTFTATVSDAFDVAYLSGDIFINYPNAPSAGRVVMFGDFPVFYNNLFVFSGSF